jgi:hypothetical protein
VTLPFMASGTSVAVTRLPQIREPVSPMDVDTLALELESVEGNGMNARKRQEEAAGPRRISDIAELVRHSQLRVPSLI